jgi:hypothetical protein
MVSKSPSRPAPSSHWTRLLILDAGTRELRMQILVARSIARLMRALTNPLTTEYGCSHFAVSRSATCCSRPIKPSVETTNGTNDRRCSKQGLRYYFFHVFSRFEPKIVPSNKHQFQQLGKTD